MASKTTAQMKCSFRNCREGGTISIESSRADVRAFPVSKSERKGMFAEWTDDGSASFHYNCWKTLCETNEDGTPLLPLSRKEFDLINEAQKTVEYHDSEETFQTEARRIAEMLLSPETKHCIGFTGAGISTAAGIGDFRGLRGAWTNNDKARDYGANAVSYGPSTKQIKRDYRLPTYTHEAICKLMDMGIIKYLISQNTDGLHRLSGIPAEKISELHGNGYEEKCEKCGFRHLCSTNIRPNKSKVPALKCPRCGINHRTGNRCSQPGCDGYMMNTIINFGDYLEDQVLGSARQNANNADLILCLGTTLRVTPAANLVDGNRLIICNRQTTPYDNKCAKNYKGGKGSRVYGDCDRLMQLVMRIILGPENAQKWENERDVRIATYDMARMSTK